MMTWKMISIYNFIVFLVSFMAEMALLVLKFFNLMDFSWWWVVVPLLTWEFFSFQLKESYFVRYLDSSEDEEN